LPQVARRRRLAVLAAYGTTALAAVALGTAFVVVAPAFSTGFRFLGQDHVLQALLVGSVVFWNVFALQDAVLVAVRKAIIVPVENAVFGVLKIALVVLLAFYGASHGVLAGWLVAMIVIVPPISWLLFGKLLRAPNHAVGTALALPLSQRGRVARYLGADYTASLLAQGCTTLLPVLVLATLGNVPSAYFYVAFTIGGTINALALALGTALVAEGAHDETALRGLARRALVWYSALLLPGILLLILAAPLLLSPFGTTYVEHATPVLRLLLVGCIPQTVVTVYLGIERVRGRAVRVLCTQALAFALLLAALALFVPRSGLEGVGLAWVVAWGLTSLATLPALLSVVGPGRRPAVLINLRVIKSRMRPLTSISAADLADAAAVLLSGGVVIMTLAGVGGVARVLVALAFVTVVPGWALVGRIGKLDGVGRAALAVGVSLALSAVGATTMAWLSAWHPIALLIVLAGGSTAVILGAWPLRRWRTRPSGHGDSGPAQPTWVGQVDISEPLHDLPVPSEHQPAYLQARLLVRRRGQPLGWVSRPVVDGVVQAEALSDAICVELHEPLHAHAQRDGSALDRSLAPARVGSDPYGPPPPSQGERISVVVCTRDRPDSLARALESLRRLRYPSFEVVVVDNAPSSEATANLFRSQFGCDARLRYVCEPRRGLACARNRGVAEARGQIVAFTDDDVIVDPDWLAGISGGFAVSDQVACVTGLIGPAELENEAQHYFDRRYRWGTAVRRRLFDLDEHEDESILFPYSAGLFGAGANFAFSRDFLLDIGGFDEILGPGTCARGGEDLDIFVRALKGGRALMYEPSAIVWHVHRASVDELRRQMYDYGAGFAAFATKYLLDSRTVREVLVRVPAGLWSLVGSWREPGMTTRIGLVEAAGMAAGSFRYLRARRLARQKKAT
jgi:GT2 family glycosyltransferase/O-antigen/teichoic acid export membrane protein